MRVRRWLLLSAVVISLLPCEAAAAGSARDSYRRAVARDQAMTAPGAPTPSVADLRRLRSGFERVAYIYPTSGYADNALQKAAAVAERIYARTKADADRLAAKRIHEWLAREYPTSPFARTARASARRLDEARQASTPAAVSPTASSRASNTPAAGAAPTTAAATTSGRSGSPASATPRRASVEPPPVPPAAEATALPAAPAAAATPVPPTPPGPLLLREVRRTVLPEVVRITLEIDAEVAYHHERLEGPPRLFFDLKDTAPAPPLRDATLSWSGDVVRRVRLGMPAPATTRVVLDLEGTRRYSVFTLYNPFRVVVDLERAEGTVTGLRPSSSPPTVTPDAPPGPVARPPDSSTAGVLADIDLEPAPPAPPVDPHEIDGRDLTLTEEVHVASRAVPSAAPATARPLVPGAAGRPARSATSAPPAAPLEPAPGPATANASGGFSLSRQLGLGISRIVIDPGHGGRDPGAQANGLSEADLVLDVALRLEKLLAKHAGTEVILTRRTDTYVALEERTAIANREQADLFLSIHANASRNRQAHGVETYFLNFATSPEAEAVAARENSASERTMHNLPDIVKAIATNNKLHESRDLAAMVQDSMVRRLSSKNRPVRSLGVKQAPFVVLIGAAMPSVLAEISFLTHAREAQLLGQNSYRQRIAEALYDAVVKYQRSLKAVGTVAEQ